MYPVVTRRVAADDPVEGRRFEFRFRIKVGLSLAIDRTCPIGAAIEILLLLKRIELKAAVSNRGVPSVAAGREGEKFPLLPAIRIIYLRGYQIYRRAAGGIRAISKYCLDRPAESIKILGRHAGMGQG